MHGLAVLQPVDEAGRFYPEYGWLHGISTAESAEQIVGDLEERGLLVEATTYEHSYPFCWRCHTPLIFRLADDWFIAVRRSVPSCSPPTPTVDWTPEYMGKRMDDWLQQPRRLEHLAPPLLRAAAAVLPVRVRAAHRDRVEA